MSVQARVRVLALMLGLGSLSELSIEVRSTALPGGAVRRHPVGFIGAQSCQAVVLVARAIEADIEHRVGSGSEITQRGVRGESMTTSSSPVTLQVAAVRIAPAIVFALAPHLVVRPVFIHSGGVVVPSGSQHGGRHRGVTLAPDRVALAQAIHPGIPVNAAPHLHEALETAAVAAVAITTL